MVAISRRSTSIWCAYSSRELCTEIHSPIAIDSAPASRPAIPVTRIVRAGQLGARDAHDEAEVRHEAVVGAQHRGAQGVAAQADAPSLGAREGLGRPARGRCGAEVMQQARVRALLLAQLVGRLRLDRVAAAVELLARGEGGQQQRRAEAGGEPARGPARDDSAAPRAGRRRAARAGRPSARRGAARRRRDRDRRPRGALRAPRTPSRRRGRRCRSRRGGCAADARRARRSRH